MFIGITGPQYSGKHTIAQYLIEKHTFQHLALRNDKTNAGRESMYDNALVFDTVDAMQLYVTERWQENFVTCSVDSRELWKLK